MAQDLSCDEPAVIVTADEAICRGELGARVAVAAERLRSLGITEGTRVGLWAENSAEWIVVALAVERVGGVLVPLNTRLTVLELEGQLSLARVALVIASDALAAHTVQGARVMSFEEWRGLPVMPGARAASPEGGMQPPAEEIDGRDAAIVFTSGTTGRPKGAVLTRANRMASARATAAVLPLVPGDRWLASLPFFHVGGLGIIQRCMMAGAGVVIPDSFAAADLGHAIEEAGVTHVSVVDTTLRRILEDRRGQPLPERVRAVVVGGGPVSPGLVAACPQALASYGLTESCAMVALARPGGTAEQRASAGSPLPGVELRIAHDGMIEVRGPMVMRGYLDDEAATRAAIVDGWLRTGDLGELTPDGSLRVFARRNDLIVSGGENVYPAEIEQALREHPEVIDAIVIGIPDEQWGETPLALVALRGAGTPDLRAFLEPRLARYKLPRISFVPEVPRLANGKPDRVAARNLGVRLRG